MSIGYVQGHADIVCYLLGRFGCDEEKVFWVYSYSVERLKPFLTLIS